MTNKGDIVTIEWWYNKKPSSRDERTGTFFGFRDNGDAEVIGPDGRHYVGTLVKETKHDRFLASLARRLVHAQRELDIALKIESDPYSEVGKVKEIQKTIRDYKYYKMQGEPCKEVPSHD